ncbi:lysozyme g-like [Dendronephthya gigantea]|uniref:lysozyme g-like n=1 Tax=Dendronephthya gigantea TaxID=151771 RepID=UPI001069E6F1|nr:lysozyme g-like [Dendronephthya gigantea]
MSVRNIQTAGASTRTASQDRLPAGIGSSQKMAERDGRYIQAHKETIISVGRELSVEPALIAAIISRESRGGTAIEQTGGWGDHGQAFGLMQIDKNWHTPQGGWNSREHIYQATNILRYFIDAKNNPFSDPDQRLKAAIAAYNKGFQGMNAGYNNIDAHTTGGDYSDDVVARAQYFQRNGYN